MARQSSFGEISALNKGNRTIAGNGINGTVAMTDRTLLAWMGRCVTIFIVVVIRSLNRTLQYGCTAVISKRRNDDKRRKAGGKIS